MEIVLKKNISYSLTYIIIIAGIIYPLRHTTDTHLILVGGLGVALWAVQLVVNLVKREYIVFDGQQVIIKDSFRKWTFNQTDVEFISINYTPFSNTYFKLKNGQKRHFNPWWLNKADTDKLLHICSVIKVK